MTAPEVRQWISRQQLSDRLGIPVGTLENWVTKGVGPRYARFGKHVRYDLADVVAWEDAQLNEVAS